MHTVLNPTAETNFRLRIPLLARPVHRAPGLEYQIKRCAAIQTAMKFSTTGGRMLSIPFNALSEASSMSFTYPPTTKLSKLFTPVFVCKPSTQNQKKSSPLFNKCSSSPSLRVNHRCRHCGTIHSWVSVIPWSFIKVIMCLYLTISVCFVYWIMSVWSALCGVVFVLILGLIVSTSSCDEIQ